MNCLYCKKPINDEVPAHGLHAACFVKEFKITIPIEFSNLVERHADSTPKNSSNSEFRQLNESFFHGKFRKYSASLGTANYIIKMQQKECPELPIIEYASNRLARLLGITVPDHHLILFNNQSPTFVSRNIMDFASTATLDHLYKFLPNHSKFSCEALCEVVLKESGRISEVYRLIDICLFDALIGNHDRHGRNLAFITKAGGVRSLSPFYDNPSYIGIADEVMLDSDLQPRGTISTKETSEPTLRDYASEFSRLGYPDEVKKFKAKTITKMHAIVDTIKDIEILTKRRSLALIQLIEKRLQELENA